MRKEYWEAPGVAWACLTRPLDALACISTWEIPTLSPNESAIGMVDIILAMEIGQGHGYAPRVRTASIRVIARIASDYRSLLDIPIYAQDEAADCLHDMDAPAEFEFTRAGEYADSHEVVERFADLCREQGFSRALIVTHALHQWRVMKLASRFGLVPYAADCSAVPMDRRSRQQWTGSEEAFRSYELQARMLYLGRGWI